MTVRRPLVLVTLGVSLAALIGGVCLLPYRFPPAHFVAGASFQVGFNNVVAYLWYLEILAVPSWALARLLPWAWSGRVPAGFDRLAEGAWRPWLLVAAAHVLLFAALYQHKGRFVFGEALYFETLLHRMTLGETPYLSFSFYYGPSMLYPAHWLGAVIGVEAAYALWFVMTYLAGLFLLWRVLLAVLPSARQATGWFLALAAGFFNPWTGLNVTFVRYLLPSAVFLLTVRAVKRGGWWRMLAVAGVLSVALTYSFEVAALSLLAIATLAAMWLLASRFQPVTHWLQAVLSLDRRPSFTELQPAAGVVLRRALWVVVPALAVAVGCFYWLDPSGQALRLYPEIAASYSAGAHNVPIYPNLPFLALTALTLLTVGGLCCGVAVWGLRGAMPLAVAYLGLALVTQRGAFGVSEPSHFAYFGLPTVLLCLWVSVHQQTWGRMVRRWVAVIVAVGLVLPLQYYHAMLFAPFIQRRLTGRVQMAGDAAAPALPSGPALEQTLTELVQQIGTQRPYLMYDLDYYSFPVYRALHLRYPSYYTMLINARTLEGMQRVIQDVRTARAVVITPVGMLTHPALVPSRSCDVKRVLDWLAGAHTIGSDLNAVLLANQARLEAPFLEFLRREYQPLREHRGLVALGPRVL